MTHVLFVYGTLKKGFQRSKYLNDQKYLGTARTKPIYGLYYVSGYPCMVNDSKDDNITLADSIYGELYEVSDDCVVFIDKVESVDTNLFQRKIMELDSVTLVNLPTDPNVFDLVTNNKAMGYFYQKSIKGAKHCGSFWPHKDKA